MKIIVAVDSFKGTLSSIDIAHLLKDHYEKDGHQVLSIPISDGGEGFVDAIQEFYNEQLLSIITYGPLGNVTEAHYLIHNDVAFIELSSVSGLNKIDKSMLNPLQTSTYGMGLLVLDAINNGAKKIIIGLGGSATNDAGTGMLQAMGVKFYRGNIEILEPMNGSLLDEISTFDDRHLKELIKDVSFEIASDVKNPLLGENGCAFVYSEQKGADQIMQILLEKKMDFFANTVEQFYNKKFRDIQGAGAAGGVGFGAMAFLNAKIHSGIDYIINLLDIEKYIKDADLVFVGEGKLDKQTKFGKAPYGIAKIAKKYQRKVIGIFAIKGIIEETDLFDSTYVIVPDYASEIESLEKPKNALEKMLKNIEVTP